MCSIMISNYNSIRQKAHQEAERFANATLESFDDLDSLSEFIDILFYMHTISDDQQFAIFLGTMYDIMGLDTSENIDALIVSENRPAIYYTCFLTALLIAILNCLGGENLCPVM